MAALPPWERILPSGEMGHDLLDAEDRQSWVLDRRTRRLWYTGRVEETRRDVHGRTMWRERDRRALYITIPSWMALVDREAASSSSGPAPEMGSPLSVPFSPSTLFVSPAPSPEPSSAPLPVPAPAPSPEYSPVPLSVHSPAPSPEYAPPSPFEVKPEPEYIPYSPVRLLHPIVTEMIPLRRVDLTTVVVDLDPEGSMGDHVPVTDLTSSDSEDEMDTSEDSDPTEYSLSAVDDLRRARGSP